MMGMNEFRMGRMRIRTLRLKKADNVEVAWHVMPHASEGRLDHAQIDFIGFFVL